MRDWDGTLVGLRLINTRNKAGFYENWGDKKIRQDLISLPLFLIAR